MRPNFARLAALPLACLTTFALSGCDGTPAQGVTCDTDLGQTDAGRKVGVFIDTANSLVVAANQIDADMQAACIGMAQDLKIPSSEYAPPLGTELNAGAKTKAACTRVNAEIKSILATDVPTTAKLTIVYTPAVCTVDVQAQTKCVEECKPVDIVVTDYMCEPGHFYGQCSAQCTGSCSGSCEGACTAACHGGCSGTCKGTCTGTCEIKAADGSCAGKCTGTCNGSCDATCTGTCSGQCGGTCSGGCSGSCTTWVQPPKCTQTQHVETVDDCETTCESRARFEAACTAPSVYVTFDVTLHPARVDLLVTAIKNNYAKLLKVSAQTTTTIGSSVTGFSSSLSGLIPYAEQVGLQAGACVATAVSAVGKAATQVEVSASFSVSISASVTASGGATAQ